MKAYPSIPAVDSAPDELLDGGHLWLQELLDGTLLRFRIDDSGGVRFGDRTTVFPPGDVPVEYRHATRFVQRALDYDAVLGADLESVVFYCVAMHQQTIDYDWDRTPAVLGIDVWEGDRFLPPDAVEQAFERIGLIPVNTFAKEVRAVDFDPDSYTVPESNWYDGQAYGVVLRSKTGEQATMHADGMDSELGPEDPDTGELVDEFVTPRRLEQTAGELSAQGQSPDADTLFEHLFEQLLRRFHRTLVGDDVDLTQVRSRLSARINEFLEPTTGR